MATRELLKKSRFAEEQMVKIRRAADVGPVAEVAEKDKLSERTIHTWRKGFGALQPNDVKRLKQLEQGTARRKRLLAERDLEVDLLKEIASGKF